MANKNTQFKFAVSALNGSDVTATITLGGLPWWSGTLNQTSPVIDLETPDTECTSIASGVVDLPQHVPGSGTLGQTSIIVTVSCSGGEVLLGGIAQQNNPIFEADPANPGSVIYVGGNPDYSDQYDISTQPLWNGVALLDRYNLADNYGITGPGSVLIEDGETCEFTVVFWNYMPVPTQ